MPQHPGRNIRRNNLDKARSAYLISARHQPVNWQEWDLSVFEAARELDLPVLLDIGAVWCHWCHVMDRESYENEQIADIINTHYVPVKIDRDERPDIDRRFQTFVQALGGGGGWPLTCFLTPEGRLFYGGTYFPPEDTAGRPGLKNLLTEISRTYHEKRHDVYESASSIFNQISAFEKQRAVPGELNHGVFSRILGDIENSFDPVYGGFGNSQKFPSGSALELAMLAYDVTHKTKYLDIARITLDNISEGGIHDHLGGGFHRYSVDPYWHVPHFEKMTSDNADFLLNYLHLYQITGEERYKHLAEGIIGYYERDMTDRTSGGFYPHQDADISLDDDGGYFTWTEDEITRHLTHEQAQIFSRYFGISAEPNDLHDSPDRNVLYAVRKLDTVADELSIPSEKARSLLEEALKTLLRVRYGRPAPFIDKTLYANINGMMLAAYAEAWKIVNDENLRQFSVKTADFLIGALYESGGGFAHAGTEDGAHVRGLLVDQVWMASGLLGVFEITSDFTYLEHVRKVMDDVLDTYQDTVSGGFYDRISEPGTPDVLSIRHKPFEDIPVASANSVCVRVLDSLYLLTGDDTYRAAAEKSLKAFAGSLAGNGVHTASYGIALFFHISPPPLVIIVHTGRGTGINALLSAAYSTYRPGARVLVFHRDNLPAEKLPPVVTSKIAGTNREPSAVAYVCTGSACAPPTGDPEELVRLIKLFGR